MKEMTKKIVVCLVLNQMLNAMPDIKERLADVLGQDVDTLDAQLLPDTLTATAFAVTWEAVSSVINWRILVAGAVGIGITYYLCKRLKDDTEILTENQIYIMSRKLLT